MNGKRPTVTELDELSAIAVEIARHAGAIIAGSTRGTTSSRKAAASSKSSATDLVTATDTASEQYIRSALARLRPMDAIVAEESTTKAGASGLTWVVDPLDGTTNFVYDVPAYAVSIALCTEDETLVGVVHDPVHDETYHAIAGKGAFRDDFQLRIPTPPAALSDALVGTGFSYDALRRRAQGALLEEVLGSVRDIRRLGAAALDLCSVASGRLDAYYEADLRRWDKAAGLLVAIEAGAVSAEVDDILVDTTTLVVAPPPLATELTELLRLAASDRRSHLH